MEEIRMPKLNQAMARGTIRKWHRREGERVLPGEPLFSVADGKTTGEVASEGAGILLKIVTQEGYPAACGAAVGYLGEEGEVPPESAPAAEAPAGPRTAVLVVGGGPGGYVAAIRAAQLGGKVTLVERGRLGGTCLNVGCIPTKAILHSAELYARMKDGAAFGVTAGEVSLDWGRVQRRKDELSARLRDGVAGLLAANGVEVVEGEASFSGPKELRVVRGDGSAQTLSADRIILASGSAPAVPPIPGVAGNPRCIDSTGALSLERVPDSMLVIGGGVIGVELAWAYSLLGTQVTVLELLPKLLPMMDGELTAKAQAKMERAGVRFLLETQVLGVEDCPAGARVTARRKDGETIALEAERVLVAAGRRPDTAALNLEAAGVAQERGRVRVNSRMETNVPGVYAVGDCLGRTMLAHAASAMGEVAAQNAMGRFATYDQKTCPSCVYIEPEFAGVGLTEEQAAEAGVRYRAGRFPLAANGKALIEGGGDGWVKLLSEERTGRVLGLHILGPRATDLIAEGALAIGMGATAGDLADVIHAHPTLSEAVREAALAAEGRAIHNH